jgi:hypothetical protein
MPSKPWGSRQEMLVDQALQSAMLDPEVVRSIRPPFPIALRPETRGFARQAATVMDVLNIDRYAASNRSWVSGMPVMNQELMGGEINGSPQYTMSALG